MRGYAHFHHNQDLESHGDDGEGDDTQRGRPYRNLMDDPGCIGEEDDIRLVDVNEVDREDTEIDFIQQIDTDRHQHVVDENEQLCLPVTSENQIEIKSIKNI